MNFVGGAYTTVDRTTTSPSPQLWLAMDTFFVVDSAGLTYHNTESPRGSQSGGP
jgi:hypothetical protein